MFNPFVADVDDRPARVVLGATYHFHVYQPLNTKAREYWICVENHPGNENFLPPFPSNASRLNYCLVFGSYE